MKGLRKKNILVSLLLLFVVIVFIPTNEALAAKWGCLDPSGECIEIESEDSTKAAFGCNEKCGQDCAMSRRLGGCPVFGCIQKRRCEDKPAAFYGDYSRKSCPDRPLAFPCPSPRDWGCFEAEKCHNVVAKIYEEAQDLCPNGKATQDSCGDEMSLSSTIKEKYGPLAGTSLIDLQKKAAKQLNPGNISEPKKLISRAINLMTAFIGSIALLLYVVAGFLWMTASGASEQVDKAKKILVWTTLGVLVMLFSYILTNTFFELIPK